MTSLRSRFSLVVLFSLVIGANVLSAGSAAAQDVITVGTVTADNGPTVEVPVSLRDASGTPLGMDQPAASRIQAFSIRVTYSPASAVSSVTFSRAGVTASLQPIFETSPSSSGAISLLDTFSEGTNLIPFTSNAALPGNQVAHLLVTLSPTAPPGAITLTLDPILTQLTDQGGSPATRENVAAGNLLLVSGSITVTAPAATPIPTLSTWAMILLAAALVVIALRMRF
jgi:hypothetical protein